MSDPLLFVDTSESNVTVTGNLHVTNHLGIGTVSPGNSLHIYKAAAEGTSGLFIEKASGGAGTTAALLFGVNAPTENPGIAKAAIFYERNLVNGRGDIKFCNDSVNDANAVTTAAADTRMIIQNNGNVGIGTVSPDTALHVNGIIKQTGANWALTNGGVTLGVDDGAHYDDFAYLNRILSTPTGVTLTHVNQGGKNTRSRITINTAGKYAMYTNGFRQTGTADTIEIFIFKNGGYQYVRAYSGPNGTSNYATAGSAYTIMDLNANDYVELYLEQATFHGNDSIYFAGHLIA
jgi:hypothetical protein